MPVFDYVCVCVWCVRVMYMCTCDVHVRVVLCMCVYWHYFVYVLGHLDMALDGREGIHVGECCACDSLLCGCECVYVTCLRM